ncbi:MAG: outer membrane protein [Alphaproteobacteria bacterium]
MRLIGAFITLAALFMSATANAQPVTYQITPLALRPYAKVALNTTFQFNLEENEAGIVSTAEIDPGLGITGALGVELAPEFDVELELSSYRGSVDFRNVAGVATTYVPEEDIMLNSLMINGFYKFAPVSNARFKLGGGIGYGQYVLTDTALLKHRGSGIVYQVKGIGEYDLTPNIAFSAEGGYIGTTDFDVDLTGSTVTRDTALDGITLGTGFKAKF